ncbi:hypothetical protein C8Q76DRAFT_697976 [Earliella scabrosa]|nr:hypothetical protein C8Q76DRAFT_697976 [Earliella scabrosa]
MASRDSSIPTSSRDPPTAQLIADASDFVSQIHYSHAQRPPAGSSARQSWDLHFTQCCKNLAKILALAAFDELPAFAIGTIWEYNKLYYSRTAVVDAEAIRPAEDERHPALDPSNHRRLRYRPNERGIVRVLPQEEMRNVWWEREVEGASSPLVLSDLHAQLRLASDERDSAMEPQDEPGPSRREEEYESSSGEPEVDAADIEKPELHAADIEEPEVDTADIEEPEVDAADIEEPEVDAADIDEDEVDAADIDEDEVDELDEDDPMSEPARGRKRARSDLSSQSEGRSRSRRRRSTPPAAGSETPAVAEEDTLYLPMESFPPVVPIAAGYGCESCRKARTVCEVNLTTGQTCTRCKQSKIRCSFRQVASKPLRTYLMWRIWKLGERGHSACRFLPAHFKLPGAAPPDWWIDLTVEKPASTSTGKSAASRHRARSVGLTSSRRRSKTPATRPVAASRRSRARSQSASSDRAAVAVHPSARADAGDSSPPSGEDDSVKQLPVRQTRSRKGKEREVPRPPSDESTASHLLAAMRISSRTASPPPPRSEPTPPAAPAPPSTQLQESSSSEGTAPALEEPRLQGRIVRRVRTGRPQLLIHSEGLTQSPKPPPAEDIEGQLSAATAAGDGTGIEAMDGNARQVLRVPTVDDSWRSLPALDATSSDTMLEVSGLDYMFAPPANYVMPRNWQALARAAARPDPMVNAAVWSRDPPPVPGTAFRIGPATSRSLEHLRDQLRRLDHLRPTFQNAAAEAEQLARHIHNARLAASTQIAETEDPDAAIRILLTEHEELAAQSRRCAQLIADVATSLSAVTEAFGQLPAIPVDGRAVAELQDLVHQLRALYGETWQRFDALREDIRPVREELHRLRVDYQQAIEMVEQVPAAAAESVQPVVDRLYDRVSKGIEQIGDSVRKSLGQLAQALDDVTLHAEDRVRLVNALWKPLSDAMTEAGQIRGTFPRPSSPPARLSDLIARLERVEAELKPNSPPLQLAVDDLVQRVRRLELASTGHQPEDAQGSEPRPRDIAAALAHLRSRVEHLEEHPAGESIDGRRADVRDYLREFGLGPEELTRLGRSTIARGTQFTFPGHDFGMSHS